MSNSCTTTRLETNSAWGCVNFVRDGCLTERLGHLSVIRVRKLFSRYVNILLILPNCQSHELQVKYWSIFQAAFICLYLEATYVVRVCLHLYSPTNRTCDKRTWTVVACRGGRILSTKCQDCRVHTNEKILPIHPLMVTWEQRYGRVLLEWLELL